jgi:uncharacterized protein
MDVTPLIPEGRQIIQSYRDGAFKISGRLYHSAIMVLPEKVVDLSFDGKASDITASSFPEAEAIAKDLDVVLIGTGDQMQFIPGTVREQLKNKGIAIDVMDTGAACRTYNVLMAEGRRVAALLIPLEKTND